MAQPASDPVTRDAREILERAAEIARSHGATEASPVDVLRATLQLPGSLADGEIRALGVDPKAIESSLAADGVAQPPLKQLLINANREAQVLGHYRLDSIHLLLAMLYSDSPATAGPLQKAGVTLYDLRQHLQTATRAGMPARQDPTQRDRGLRRRPWPSLRGVIGVSPVFLGLLGLTAVIGALLWTNLVPGLVTLLTILFVVGLWVASLCLHEFGHSIVAYLGGDRSVANAGYLSLNPLRYANLAMSAVAVAGLFFLGFKLGWMTTENGNFFAALAVAGFFQVLAVVLNLLPVPGIDGFGIIRPWLPHNVQYAAMRYGMLAIYGVFLAIWFVTPIRAAFYGAVFSLVSLAGIPAVLVFIGQLNMRFI